MSAPVAALFVRADGPYPLLVQQWWDGSPGRDAREYPGTLPVVAHPPCARWGTRWWSDGSAAPGMDGGAFVCALRAVRAWGGVLEHPAGSRAWASYGIAPPAPVPETRRYRGYQGSPETPQGDLVSWTRAGDRQWVAEIDQEAWGHRARKRTWLLYVGDRDPQLAVPPRAAHPGPTVGSWRSSPPRIGVQRMSRRQRELTPPALAAALVALAATCGRPL